jgi:hypothetical protein
VKMPVVLSYETPGTWAKAMAAEAAMRRAEVFMIGSSLGGSGLVYTSALGSCVCWKAEVIRLVMIQNRLPKKRA